ncbi:MAG TPA: DUF3368 domain-containing protein [Candidatus Nanoarchaeia archaeon]|nr:DUF3368 domain-containing protein [Candidatus Nanoarchaeia archaeon]
MVVSNTSPILYLAKLGKLELLKKLFNKVFIPREVYKEAVLNGREKGFVDATLIERAIKDHWIEVKDVVSNKNISIYSEIDVGEQEAIELAKNLNSKLLLIDDAPARVIAESFGLSVKGTLFVLMKAYSKKIINKIETKNLLSRLISLGFRISPELYGKILDEIDKI